MICIQFKVFDCHTHSLIRTHSHTHCRPFVAVSIFSFTPKCKIKSRIWFNYHFMCCWFIQSRLFHFIFIDWSNKCVVIALCCCRNRPVWVRCQLNSLLCIHYIFFNSIGIYVLFSHFSFSAANIPSTSTIIAVLCIQKINH